MRPRRRYDPGFKATLLAELVAGEPAGRVARRHGIPRSTAKSWRRRLRRGEIPELVLSGRVADVATEAAVATLGTLTLQQRATFRDPAWLANQNAADLALLHGIAFDKCMRLLEALG